MRALLLGGALLFLLLLLTACIPEQERMASGQVTVRSAAGVVPAAVERTYELRLADDGFFPATFHANPGDTVDLVFLLEAPRFISVPELGIAERVHKETLELSLREPGEYDIICLDCDDPFVAVISVGHEK
ncbi:hypothetical protein GF367_02520 [Candidatus Woesearchaeota archaeon]|nr:hypothetical protein [Candidatus Woesearchaeota archaeon]